MCSVFVVAPGFLFTSDNASAAEPVDYAAKIGPLFEERCVDCHAADDPEGEFVIESFETLMKGGKAGDVIKPGDAQNSLLVKFLEGRSGREGKNRFMPPGKKEHLTAEQISLIRLWIDAGAPAPAVQPKPAEALVNLPKIPPKATRQKAIQALAFSAKAKLLAAGSYGTVQLLDATSHQTVRTIEGIDGKVNAVLFSPDGQMLFGAAGIAGVNGVAYQWRVGDGGLVRKYEGHTDALYALALTPDGAQLATGGYDQKIKLWSVADGSEAKLLKGHNGAVFGLSFRPDGKVLASASADRTVKLWSVADGKRLDTFSQPLKEQTTVRFSPDGKTVAAGGADNRIRVWRVSDEAAEGSNELLFTHYAHEGSVLSLAFSPDGQTIVSSAADRTVKISKAADLTELHLLNSQPDWPSAVAFLESTLAVARIDGSLGFYDAATGKSAEPKPPMKAPAKPEIARLSPGGMQSGTAAQIKVTGKNLQDLKKISFDKAGLSVKIGPITADGSSADLLVTAQENMPRGTVEIKVTTAAGDSEKKKFLLDDLPQIVPVKSPKPVKLETVPTNVWGTLTETGQQDNYLFSAKQGESLVFDLGAKRIDSKALTPRLEIFDAEGRLLIANNALDSGSDPFIGFTVPHDGEYTVRVLEITLEGSPDHAYRLTAGRLPYVTGWWPLSVPANQESQIHLVGYNLEKKTVTVKAGADGEVTLPSDSPAYRSRVNVRASVSPLPESLEQEPNDTVDHAQFVNIPASLNGRLFSPEHPGAPDADLYAFDAEKDQRIVIETRAAMMGSPADTKIEVLDAQGNPVPHLILQATKDSWVALRSKDAKEGGIRLGQFSEMDLDDYMYFNGEILKIFRMARGPDSDMFFYTRNGVRRDWFDSSPSAHGLDEPCYVVEPKPPGSKIVPNGLPVFTLDYTNDDDAERQLGRDSRLIFTAPARTRYLVRVTDTRGWSGERYAYRLILREPKPDFSATLATKENESLRIGTGLQFLVKVDREDGFEGDVRIDIKGAPENLFVSTPIVVQKDHLTAAGTIFSRPSAKEGKINLSQIKMIATASVEGRTVSHDLRPFPEITIAPSPKRLLFLEPDVNGKPQGDGKTAPSTPFEATISPGERIPVWLRVDRQGDNALLALDVENLPHGVIVDSIGLNGVQIRENEIERQVFLSCEKWVPEQERLCHIVAGSATSNESVAGLETSFPMLLKVRKAAIPVAIK